MKASRFGATAAPAIAPAAQVEAPNDETVDIASNQGSAIDAPIPRRTVRRDNFFIALPTLG